MKPTPLKPIWPWVNCNVLPPRERLPRSRSNPPSSSGRSAVPRMCSSPPRSANSPLPRTKIWFAAVTVRSRATGGGCAGGGGGFWPGKMIGRLATFGGSERGMLMLAFLIRTVPPRASLPRSVPSRCRSASNISFTMSEETGVALLAVTVTLSGILAPPRSTLPEPEICPCPAVAVSASSVTRRPVAPTRALILVRLRPEEMFCTSPSARVALPRAWGAAGVPVTAISTVTIPRTTLPWAARSGSSRRRSVRPFRRRLIAPFWLSGTCPLAVRAMSGPATICALIVARWLVKSPVALMSAGGSAGGRAVTQFQASGAQSELSARARCAAP